MRSIAEISNSDLNNLLIMKIRRFETDSKDHFDSNLNVKLEEAVKSMNLRENIEQPHLKIRKKFRENCKFTPLYLKSFVIILVLITATLLQ